MPEPDRQYYFDTVTLSNFVLSGRLDLLIARYGRRANITPQVLDEVADGIVAGYAGLREVETAVTCGRLSGVERFSPEERDTYRELLQTLSPGEASCITFAQTRGGIVATDDRAARGCCFDRGVVFTGTVGILKACVLDGTLSPREADDVLRAMTAAGYHSPVGRISALVLTANRSRGGLTVKNGDEPGTQQGGSLNPDPHISGRREKKDESRT